MLYLRVHYVRYVVIMVMHFTQNLYTHNYLKKYYTTYVCVYIEVVG